MAKRYQVVINNTVREWRYLGFLPESRQYIVATHEGKAEVFEKKDWERMHESELDAWTEILRRARKEVERIEQEIMGMMQEEGQPQAAK